MSKKILVKIVIHNTDDKKVRSKVLFRLLRKYSPKTVQFFIRLNRKQIAGLKRAYGDKISIIHSDLLRRDRLDKPPKNV